MNTDPKTLFHLARGGETLGERTQEDILFSLRTGELRRDDLAWTEGMPEWMSIGSIPAFTEAESAGTEEKATAPALPTGTIDLNPGSSDPILSPATRQAGPENGAPPLASLGARLVGAIADMLIFFAAIAVPLIAIDGPEVFADDAADPSDLASMVMVFTFLLLAVIQLVLLSVRSQSLGKMLARTRIHHHATGEPAGFVHTVLLRGIVGNLPTNIPFIGIVYWIVDVCFIFRSDRRCIHDLIGGTIVCKVP